MTPAQLAIIHAASFTHPRPWSETEFNELLSKDRVHLVTTQNGFALVQIVGPEAELLTIAVHPNARRNGEGAQLLTAVESAANSANCVDIFLEVVDTNTHAIALYHAAGFQERAIRKDYYNGPNGVKSSALILHKSL